MTEPARMVRLVGDAEYRDQAEASLSTPGDASMVFRSRPRSIVMACPDGCGETLVINLDSRADKAWRFDMRGEGLTLFPSVWREGGCESHFIVWRGHILWCDRFEGEIGSRLIIPRSKRPFSAQWTRFNHAMPWN